MRYNFGERIGPFEILGRLGEGGMGVVYRARDTRIGREVALKLLPPSYALEPDRIARFRREASVLASLNHPNIGGLHDVLEVDGAHVLVLELIEGETLGEAIRRAPLTADRAVALFAQIARALEAAHQKGIVHRDLKPGNIKVGSNGTATVIDFGIAKTAAVANLESDADTQIPGATPDALETTNGLLIGTPAYMSPEQVRGGQIDERADIWAFGCCLYQALTGQLPFHGDTATDTVAAILRSEPDWELLPPDLPPEAYVVLRRCLEKNAALRLRSAGDIALLLTFQADATDESAHAARDWVPVAGESVLGRPNWRLDERLGEGGFGEVWLAAHRKTDSKRVFKFCRDVERIRGLKREVILFRLLKQSLGDRKDIAQIIDWQFERAPYYLESEYTQAGDLAQWAETQGGIGALPLETRLDIVAQVARAVAAAHSVGILHKDIKPSNVLIAQGEENGPQAVLTDFGIGYLTDRHLLAEKGITATGLTEAIDGSSGSTSGAGTRMYMAPELIEGKGATMQSDVYALGVLLYQAAAGDFARALAPGWERDIEDPLVREDVAACVDRDISHRLQSASELAERLLHLKERRAEREREDRIRETLQQAQDTAALARIRRIRLVAVAATGVAISVLLTLYAIRETQRASVEADLRSEAESRSQEAHRERERAEENLQIARGAVDEFFVKMGRSSLVYDPSYAPLRTSLIKSSLQYHQQFVDAYRDVPALRGDMAWTYFTMAAMLMQLEDATWFDAYADGLELLAEILRTETRPEDLGRMAEGVWHAGATGGPNAINSIRMDPKRAFELGQRAIELTESLAVKYPQIRAIRNDLAIDYHLLGHMVEPVSRERAMAAHQRALALWSDLLEEDSESIDYMYGAALSLNRIGSLHDLAGNTTEALDHLERARAMYERVLSHSPGVPQFYETYARFLNNYGQALANSGQMEKGVEAFDTGSARLDELMATYPSLKNFHPLAADIAYRRGRTEQRLGQCDAAVQDFNQAIALSADSLEKVTLALAEGVAGNCANPELALTLATDATTSRSDAPTSWRALAAVRLVRKEFQPALDALMRAITLETKGPAHVQDLFSAARCHVELGSLEKARELHDQAVAVMDALSPGADESLQALKAESEALLARGA
ncbi:MAG: protein kinase [Candidatus Hydrogenedentes bacterium]|nr:protein kinase [Candidatus Hydrogenedentota bacterium]